MDAPAKQCSRCGLDKPTDCFCKNSRSADGLNKICRTCKAAASRKYREENRTKIRKAKRAYRRKNRTKIREQQSKWLERNAATVKEKKRLYYLKNWDRHRLNCYRRSLRVDYGLEYEDYLRLVDEHDNRCAICGISAEENKNKMHKGKLSVDHDHKTKIVRGLLCDGCNNGLARFADNPELLRRAADYLERQRSRNATA